MCPRVDVRRARLPAAATISLPSVRVKQALKFLTMWQKSESVPLQQRGTVGKRVWEERWESGGSQNDQKPTESRRLKAEFFYLALKSKRVPGLSPAPWSFTAGALPPL